MLEPSRSNDPFGKLLLRRRSPYTSIALASLAFASLAVPYVALSAETEREWIGVAAAGIPFPLFFAYSIAIRLEIFERVIRIRKLWGTRVIPLTQLQSFDRHQVSSGRVRLSFKAREGRSIRVTVAGYDPDDELQAVLDEVARHAAPQA